MERRAGPFAEDARQLHRELITARRDRTRTINRIKSLMATQGIEIEVKSGLLTALQRLLAQRELVRQIEAERNRIFRESHDPAIKQVRQLYSLRGVGKESWYTEHWSGRALSVVAPPSRTDAGR